MQEIFAPIGAKTDRFAALRSYGSEKPHHESKNPSKSNQSVGYKGADKATNLSIISLFAQFQRNTRMHTHRLKVPIAIIAILMAALSYGNDIVGQWRWTPDDQIVTIHSNHNCTSNYRSSGVWQVINAETRTYQIRWTSGFVDKLTLSADGNSLTGSNQHGAQPATFHRIRPGVQLPINPPIPRAASTFISYRTQDQTLGRTGKWTFVKNNSTDKTIKVTIKVTNSFTGRPAGQLVKRLAPGRELSLSWIPYAEPASALVYSTIGAEFD